MRGAKAIVLLAALSATGHAGTLEVSAGQTAAELALLAPIAATGATDPETRRFLEAEKAIRGGHLAEFRRLAAQLEHYPLYPYLVFAELTRRLPGAKAVEVDDFLARYADSPLSERLRQRWLKVLARRGRWQDVVGYSIADEDQIGLRCLHLRALLETGAREQAFAQVPEIWLAGESRPKECDPVFNAWRDAKRLTPELVWARIGLAMDRGRPGLARYLSRYLPEGERDHAGHWIALRRSPERAATLPGTIDDALAQRMQAYAARRLARKDPDAAADLWARLSGQRAFSDEHTYSVYRAIGMAYARAGEPAGSRWLSKIPPGHRDEHARHWHLASAVLHGAWQDALDGTTAPVTDGRDAEQRRYWQARSLEALGHLEQARVLYDALARERHFYGFLAADRTGAPYFFGHRPLPASETSLLALASTDPARRIRLLRMLDRMLDARREWYYWVDRLDEDRRALAAKLAQRWGWHDAGILTVARTPHRDDLELRFPLAYTREANGHAAKHGLEPAMVLALIRQESAFMADATSPKGARGLMQLMPATGRRVAKRLGVRVKRRSEFYDPSLNVRLGTAYFARMLDDHQSNPVLALGAYNAGPRRVTQWRKRIAPAEADVWVENIAFYETREYVKRVLAYTAVYEHRLGLEPTRLSDRMGTITPP